LITIKSLKHHKKEVKKRTAPPAAVSSLFLVVVIISKYIKTGRTDTNLFIVTDTVTLGNEIPVNFVGKTRATEEATAV